MNISSIINIRNIYILATINCILLYFFCGRQWDYDTQSYISAWNNISSMHIDIWRTPVYPIFIGFTQKCFGSYYLMAGTIIQHLVFLISIFYFYKSALHIVESKRISVYITAIYALYPCYATWNCFNLTEPFAIHSMVFTLYCAITAYRNNSTFHIVAFGFWILFQIFLRPAQIYILPVFLLGWILLFIKERRVSSILIGGITCIILASCLMFVYMLEFKRAYGVFAPCGVGIVNKYYMARRDGTLKYNNIKNIELRKYIAERDKKFQEGKGTNIDLFVEAQDAVYIFGAETVSENISLYNKTTLSSQIKSIFQRFHNAAQDILLDTFIKKLSFITDIIGFRINLIYYLLIIYPIVLAYCCKKQKTIPWFSSTIYLLGSCHLLIIIVACQNIWGRLILPATPIYLLMTGQLINNLILFYSPNNSKSYARI